jgi:outer membrane usher protein
LILPLEKEEGDRLHPCLSIEQLKNGASKPLFPVWQPKDILCQSAGYSSCQHGFSVWRAAADYQHSSGRDRSAGTRVCSPELWDEGITAAMLNYSLSGRTTGQNNGSKNSDSQYANLRPGINVGPWRLRNYTTWSRDETGQDKWDTVYTYAQRAIIPLNAQLTLGDSSAPADVFDSMPFRGANWLPMMTCCRIRLKAMHLWCGYRAYQCAGGGAAERLSDLSDLRCAGRF